MTNKLRAQYSARNRIYFNLYTQKHVSTDNKKQQPTEQNKNQPVCFWTDEEYVSER